MYSSKRYIRKKQVCERFKKTLKKNATKAEKHFLELLTQFRATLMPDFKFSFQKGWIEGKGFYISDFYFEDSKITIEIDGGYHSAKKQVKKDVKKSNYLLERGIKTIRITNNHALSMKLHDLIAFLGKNNII